MSIGYCTWRVDLAVEDLFLLSDELGHLVLR